MKMRRIFAVAMSLCLLLSLFTGCTQQADEPEETNAPEVSEAPAPEQTDTPEVAVPEQPEVQEPAQPDAKDGVYTTSAQGRNGLVTVETKIENSKIVAVELKDHIETNVFTTTTIPRLIESIIENNSYGVDVVSGATWTSYAVKTAVAQAVKEAGGTDEAYNIVPTVDKGADETVTVDVAVVGAGISGLMAATKAGADGATVALIEKTSLLGGCSLQSFGAAYYEGEAIQARFIDWIQDQHYMVDTTVLNAYLTNNSQAFGFLRSYNEKGDYFPYMPANTLLVTYMDRAPIYADMMEKEVTGKNGHVFLETTAQSLIAENGAVTGVVCRKADGSTLTVNAKSVIIATGGYGGNTELVKQYTGYDVVCGCLTQCVGEGMQMVWDVGGKVPSNMGGLQLHQTLAAANLTGFEYFQMRMPMILSYLPSVLNVTPSGVRFRNEEWANVATSASTSGAFAGGTTYVLVSQSTLDLLESGGTVAMGSPNSPGMPPEYKPDFQPDTPWTDVKAVMDAMVTGGWGFYGETIEDLAVAAGMDPTTLTETFNNYQSYCSDGFDPVFNKAPEYLVGYEYGPYYLVETNYNQLGTISGIVINAKTQVLDENDAPIPGLYSTGADAFGVLWDHHYNGMGDCIGWAITSGYMGGTQAAEYALSE